MSAPDEIPGWWWEENRVDFWDDYHAGIWEPETHRVIDQYVTAGSTFLDIGAWIGPTTLWGAVHAKRVVAIEPDPVAREFLALNIADYDNVNIYPVAVGPTTEQVKLVAHQQGFGSSMTRLLSTRPDANTWNYADTIDVDQFTVADLFDHCELDNVSLVKLDIEGGEAEILETTARFLADRRIPFLCSLHEDWWTTTLLDRAWFDGFTELTELAGGPCELLAVP